MRWLVAVGIWLAGLALVGSASAAELVRVTPDGYPDSDPSFLTAPPGDSRAFLVERGDPSSQVAGIRIIDGGVPVAEPFLSIGDVDTFSERGLLSMAFAPDYAASGLFYVFYVAAGPDPLDPSGTQGDIRIVEYRRSAGNPDAADPGSARLVMKVPHPAGNHNGGWMAFGPDGHLYLTIGDNANSSNAQSLANLYGKVMRIDPADPAGAPTYSIPADNPFRATPGARGEIYAYGLRNPYRASFAPDGRLVIGDVGNSTWEEVDAGDLKGKNLGWPSCEGFCQPANPAFADPVFAYRQDGDPGGCAVLGGYVVRDSALSGLAGRYLYGDLCDQALRTIDLDSPGGDPKPAGFSIPGNLGNLRSFGEDARGCVYVLSNRAVFRVVGDDAGTVACPAPPELPDPPGPPPPDVTYASFIPARAIIARRLRVGAKCSIACTATARAKVRISRNRHRRRVVAFRLRSRKVGLAAGARRAIPLLIPRRRIRPMRLAARNGSRVLATVKVTMTGADSSGGSGTRTVRLVRPKRR